MCTYILAYILYSYEFDYSKMTNHFPFGVHHYLGPMQGDVGKFIEIAAIFVACVVGIVMLTLAYKCWKHKQNRRDTTIRDDQHEMLIRVDNCRACFMFEPHNTCSSFDS